MEFIMIDPLMNNWAIARDIIVELKRHKISDKDLLAIAEQIKKQLENK